MGPVAVWVYVVPTPALNILTKLTDCVFGTVIWYRSLEKYLWHIKDSLSFV